MIWDRYGQLKPSGPDDWYRNRTEAFSIECPFAPAAADEDVIASELFQAAPNVDRRIGRFEAAYVGAANDPFRLQGSSGGMVSWVAAKLLETGAIDAVAHVTPATPETGAFFRYRLSRTVEELGLGAKSRYHPIHLQDILRTIRDEPGRYAIVGVPCFIKAVHLLRREDPILRDRITHTLGLFCGHMKSARFVESFAWQLGVGLDEVQAVDYRIKDQHRPANWYRAHLSLKDGSSRAEDWWHLADGDWGAGFFQNSACNFCDDVVAETADVSFGDAWVEPYASDGRGTNVVIARTPGIMALIEGGMANEEVELAPVDADFIAQTQAAGLRHRREGLAYRLTWMRPPVRPRKRVKPSVRGLRVRRRLVYRMRAWISRWSHRVAWAARKGRSSWIYTHWATAALKIYQALTYSRGRLGKLSDRLLGDSAGG
jgi:coenzyme F420-reducing hydrogenase beta subunit